MVLWKIDIKKTPQNPETSNGRISKTRINLESRLRFPESSFNFPPNSIVLYAFYPRGYMTEGSARYNSRLRCQWLTRLKRLSNLWFHKFKYSFQDTLNPICNCGTFKTMFTTNFEVFIHQLNTLIKLNVFMLYFIKIDSNLFVCVFYFYLLLIFFLVFLYIFIMSSLMWIHWCIYHQSAKNQL